ncbi:MAG: carbohydrate ABC transporter permease [Acidothermales bacterium]|nr:carbohydrate ABC transporter permease [Acidothermales bacterium]
MRESRSFKVVRVVGLTFLTLFVVTPLYVMISSAAKPLGDVQGAFRWIPSRLTVRPFVDIWTTVPLARFFLNSVIVSLSATVASLVIAVFAAYGISRYRFPGRGVFRMTVLSTQMFPGILFLLPLYLIYVSIGQATGYALNGSRLGLVITYLTFSLPFSIWMLSGYFDSIPKGLDEAAMVDGAGPLRIVWRIIVPAARPGIVAVGVYAFITAWGETLFASVLTNDTSETLAIGLREYSTQISVYWNQLMAASFVVSVPVVVGFLLLQRHLVRGLAGAVK